MAEIFNNVYSITQSGIIDKYLTDKKIFPFFGTGPCLNFWNTAINGHSCLKKYAINFIPLCVVATYYINVHKTFYCNHKSGFLYITFLVIGLNWPNCVDWASLNIHEMQKSVLVFFLNCMITLCNKKRYKHSYFQF